MMVPWVPGRAPALRARSLLIASRHHSVSVKMAVCVMMPGPASAPVISMANCASPCVIVRMARAVMMARMGQARACAPLVFMVSDASRYVHAVVCHVARMAPAGSAPMGALAMIVRGCVTVRMGRCAMMGRRAQARVRVPTASMVPVARRRAHARTARAAMTARQEPAPVTVHRASGGRHVPTAVRVVDNHAMRPQACAGSAPRTATGKLVMGCVTVKMGRCVMMGRWAQAHACAHQVSMARPVTRCVTVRTVASVMMVPWAPGHAPVLLDSMVRAVS